MIKIETKANLENESVIKPKPNRNTFYLLFSSSMIVFAHTMFNLTIMWTVFEQTGSAFITSAIATISHLATIFGGPISGYLVDKYSPQNILRFAYLTISLGILLLGIIYYFMPFLLIYAMFLLLILIDFTSTLSYPAKNRLIPKVIPTDQLHKVNGLSVSINKSSSLLGNATSGFILAFFGLIGSILIDSIAFLLAAICIVLLKLLKPDSEMKSSSKAHPNMIKSLIEGLTYIKGHALIKRLTIMAFFLNVASFIYPLYIVLISVSYDAGAKGYGMFQAMGTAGSILGGLCVPFFKKRWNIAKAIGYSFLVTCIGTIWLGLNHLFFIAIIIFFIINVFETMQKVFMNVFFMTAVPDELRGRVLGTMFSISSAAIPLFVLLGGYLADSIDVKWMFVIAGIWLGLFSIYMFTSKGIKDAISKTNEVTSSEA